MRAFLDTLAAHTRELGRHGIIWILTTGTAVATIYALSGGQLTLPAVIERLLSIGGIAAGLELAIVYIGLHIQALDMRIKAAKRAEVRAEYQGERRRNTLAFFAILAISFACGGIYRTQALHNTLLGWFEAAIPPVLIYIFTIVLRRLPPDYAELGRQAAMQSMVEVTRESGTVMRRFMKRIGRGGQLSEDDMRTLGFAVGVIRMYMPSNEQVAIEYALQQSGAAGQVVDSEAQEYLTTAQISERYQIPPRTAQQWASEIPGRRRAERGNRWLVPADALYQSRGIPGLSVGHRSASQTHMRVRAQNAAMEPQEDAAGAQIAVVEAQ